ncbi:MAG: hypothetical protein OXM02_08625 [Bacteroidota bacterium]|nr:hypothetical protein [Bacteroidota bacterium]MDE2957039.1 hypothetical protein [Bacteroidota bacterium]
MSRCLFAWRMLALLTVVAVLPVPAGWTQSVPTNMAMLQHIAVDCLSEVPTHTDTLVVSAPEAMPYLASAVVGSFQRRGLIVYLGEEAHSARPVLSWIVDIAGVTYVRAGSGTVERTVRLELQYLFVGPDGRVLGSGPCGQSLTDEVPRNELSALETAAYPETQAEPPKVRWIRRYVEPVVLAVATGLAAFLFFNLRSNRADR